MSSLHHRKGRRSWYCAYRGADGRQYYKSTGTSIRAEAQIVCAALAKLGRAARKKKLTPERARAIVDAAVRELMDDTGQVLPHSTIRSFFTSWIKEKENEGAESTFQRYQGIVTRFLKFLGPRADQSLCSLGRGDILTFRDELADQVSDNTVNVFLKVLRVAMAKAVEAGLVDKNCATSVRNFKRGQAHQRRSFTMDELKKLYDAADQEWRTMLLVGLYSGLRLADIANLTWANLDLRRQELTVSTAKTGRTQILPIAKPLLRHLEKLPAGDDPQAALCPSLEGKPTASLSNAFFNLMAGCGLVRNRKDHSAKKGGRSKRRELNAISFHALRHTATSLLKNAGVSDAIAMDIIGHESAAISKNYSHISTEAKRAAVDKMPDFLG